MVNGGINVVQNRCIFILLFILLLVAGFGRTIDYVQKKEQPFVQLRLYSASEGTYLDFFPQKITIANNGGVRIFTEDIVDDLGCVQLETAGAPMYEGKISGEEVERVKRVIGENNFLSLPEDVTDYDVMDGSGSEVTVYLESGEKKVRGENSSNEQFTKVVESIFESVRYEYKEWYEETRAYLEGLNDMEDE